MITWNTIQEALETWFGRVTNLPIEWEDEGQENRHRPYAELGISSVIGIGVDQNLAEYDETEPEGRRIVRTATGDRQFTLSCKVVSRDGTPKGSARMYIEKARTSLHSLWAQEIFKEAELSVATVLSSVEIKKPYQNRIENISIMDVRFNTVVNVVDPKEQGTHIETVQVSSEIADLPDDLELDDEEMP